MVSHNGQGESNLSRQHTRLTTCPSQRKTFWIENYRPPRSHASFARLQVLQLYSWVILSLEQEIVDHGPTRYWWRMERCGISKCKHLSSIWSCELNEAYYHSGDRWRWCEYIAFRGLWRIAFARVHESDITDTELQVGHIVIVTSIDANSMHGTGWQVHASKTRRASNLRKQSGAVLAYRGKWRERRQRSLTATLISCH